MKNFNDFLLESTFKEQMYTMRKCNCTAFDDDILELKQENERTMGHNTDYLKHANIIEREIEKCFDLKEGEVPIGTFDDEILSVLYPGLLSHNGNMNYKCKVKDLYEDGPSSMDFLYIASVYRYKNHDMVYCESGQWEYPEGFDKTDLHLWTFKKKQEFLSFQIDNRKLYIDPHYFLDSLVESNLIAAFLTNDNLASTLSKCLNDDTEVKAHIENYRGAVKLSKYDI